jgi:LemA protein
VLWLLIVLAIVVVVALIVVAFYNRLVRLRNRAENAWAQVDVQLRRRYDLIPNLVETVKGYAAHEREVFEEVTRARSQAMAATGSPAQQAQAEQPLVAALGRLFAVAENYPQLRATENFQQLQAELANTEDRLQTARRFYNNNVQDYNRRVQSFPSNVVASMFNFEEEEFFEVDEALRGEAGVPHVSFEAGAPGVTFREEPDATAPAPSSDVPPPPTPPAPPVPPNAG